jgi:hypothetical protein
MNTKRTRKPYENFSTANNMALAQERGVGLGFAASPDGLGAIAMMERVVGDADKRHVRSVSLSISGISVVNFEDEVEFEAGNTMCLEGRPV